MVKRKKIYGGVVQNAFCIQTIDCNSFCIQRVMGLTVMPLSIRQLKGLKEYPRRHKCVHYVKDICMKNEVDSNVLGIPEGKCQVFR